MDKIKKVSISGLVFNLEEEAEGIIRNYLDVLSEYYKSRTDGNEIMEGIESRLAELFVDRGGRTGVITGTTAREVTGIIGRPEDLFDGNSGEKADCAKPRKRFYRNPEDKIIKGVCGGLAAYYDIDPLWIRLAFVALGIAGIAGNELFEFGPMVSVLIYCILWAIMPMANTTAQRCEMRGKGLTYEDIERQVENGREGTRGSKKPGFFMACLRVFVIFSGCILLTTGFAGIIALFCATLGLSIAGLAMPGFLVSIIESAGTAPGWSLIILKTLSGLVCIIPFVALLYGGIRLVFNFRAPQWKPGIVMLLIWLCSAVALLIIGLATIPNILTL